MTNIYNMKDFKVYSNIRNKYTIYRINVFINNFNYKIIMNRTINNIIKYF
jgi:hypothetical protein